MQHGSTAETWLTDLAQLSAAQRREVVSVFRRGLVESPLPASFAEINEARELGCNAQLEEMLGIDETWIHGRGIEDLVHPDDRDKAYAVYERSRSGQSTREVYEGRWIRPDGRVVWTRRHVIRVDGPNSDGKT